jgi:hypothetical protein
MDLEISKEFMTNPKIDAAIQAAVEYMVDLEDARIQYLNKGDYEM